MIRAPRDRLPISTCEPASTNGPVRLFDRYLESEEKALPELWQRGIALYFMRDYDAAAKQFEVHRSVNPNDVENAAWHFLCVAKSESPSEAKGKIATGTG